VLRTRKVGILVQEHDGLVFIDLGMYVMLMKKIFSGPVTSNKQDVEQMEIEIHIEMIAGANG